MCNVTHFNNKGQPTAKGVYDVVFHSDDSPYQIQKSDPKSLKMQKVIYGTIACGLFLSITPCSKSKNCIGKNIYEIGGSVSKSLRQKISSAQEKALLQKFEAMPSRESELNESDLP